jgi:VanZ family protein
MRRATVRVLLYVLPLLIWLTIAALAATELGSYQNSWNILHKFMDWIEPGFYYSDPQILSMYQLTQATRKLAHVIVYGILTLLTIRLCQAGRPKLRLLSFILALLLSVLFFGAEVYVRLHQSENTRHFRWEQLMLNGIGVGLVMIGTLLFFGLKSLERKLLQDL